MSNALLGEALKGRGKRTPEQKQDDARERGAAVADTFAGGAKDQAAKKMKEWKRDRRSISVWIHKDQHKALNMMRVETGLSVRRLVEEAVNELLALKGKPRVDLGDDPDKYGELKDT